MDHRCKRKFSLNRRCSYTKHHSVTTQKATLSKNNCLYELDVIRNEESRCDNSEPLFICIKLQSGDSPVAFRHECHIDTANQKRAVIFCGHRGGKQIYDQIGDSLGQHIYAYVFKNMEISCVYTFSL